MLERQGRREQRQNKKAKKGGLQRYAAALERTDCNGQGFVWAGLLFAHMNKRANQPFMHMPTRLAGTFCVSRQLAHPPTHRLSCLGMLMLMLMFMLMLMLLFCLFASRVCLAFFAHLDLPTSTWPGLRLVAFAVLSYPICPQRDLSQVDSS